MTKVLLLTFLIASGGAMASTMSPYGPMVDASSLRICQAAGFHEDGINGTIIRAKKSWIYHRFEKPVAIKLRRTNQEGLMVKLLYANGGYQSFYAGKLTLRHTIPSVQDLAPMIAGDIQVPLVFTKMSPARFGMEAALLGYDAFYQNGEPVLIKKFFRRNMTESEWKLAVTQTLNHDLGQPNWMQTCTETTVSYMQALSDIRSEAEKLAWFDKDDRWFDWREFPMPIQRKISNAVDLYWKAQEWQFLREVATHIK